jgi:hypothetical protein
MRGARIGAVALLGASLATSGPVSEPEDAGSVMAGDVRVAVPRRVSDGVVLEQGGYRLPFRLRPVTGGEHHHALRANGMEDFVRFETRPAREELSYSVDVSSFAGLRLVENTLEFLDRGGAPQFRVSPPYVVGADGEQRAAALTVEGCAFDENPAGPWGRAVTPPGSAECTAKVSWGNVPYPAVIDPEWSESLASGFDWSDLKVQTLATGQVLLVGSKGTWLYDPASNEFAATGALGGPRCSTFSMTRLASGKVLAAGGIDRCDVSTGYKTLASAELYDPSTGKFTPTGSMGTARVGAHAVLLGTGQVLVVGGSPAPLSQPMTTSERYDPVSGTFSPSGSRPKGDAYELVPLSTGKVLVLGGATPELYDPQSGSFTPSSATLPARNAVLLQSGKVLFVVADGTSKSVLYDPVTNAVSDTGASTYPRVNPASYTLPSGEVLVVGGLTTSLGYAALAEMYNPTSGVFRRVPNPPPNDFFPRGAILPSGRVFFATDKGKWWIFTGTAGDACASDSFCNTGHCVDGVCCDTACEGQCEACDVTPGVCARVNGVVHGQRPACAEGEVCSQITNKCGAPGLAGSATCDGDHTTTTADGLAIDCAPYKCDSNGTCRIACTSVNDCVASTVCDASGKCVPKPGGDGDSGCVLALATLPTTPGKWVFALLVLGAMLTRRRRPCDHR